MSVRILCLSAATGLVLAACATSQENPNYQVSTKYKGSNPYAATTTTASTTPASTRTVYQSQAASTTQYRTVDQQPVQYRTISAGTGYTQVNQECLSAEKKRELLGGAIGGTVGAIAGKKLIGGTGGTIAGAALGGTVGYGIGDKSINCDPVYIQPQSTVTQSYQPSYQTQPAAGQAYSTQSYQTPASTQYVQTAPQPIQTAPANQSTIGTPGYYAVNGGQPPVQTQPVQVVQQPYPQQQTVYVPITQPQTPPAAQVPAPVFVQTMQGKGLHQVVEGDTVYSMSKQLCVSVDDIQRLNGLDGNYNIKLGQNLQLPASRCPR